MHQRHALFPRRIDAWVRKIPFRVFSSRWTLTVSRTEQRSLRSWSRKSPNLKGTWLVTLSACDTGSGQARAGEGVMGLRRGYIQAGAQNLLMTLWPISDEVTVQIMSDFYEAAHDTWNAPEALAEVQRKWLLKLRTEKGLAQEVNLETLFTFFGRATPDHAGACPEACPYHRTCCAGARPHHRNGIAYSNR